MSEIERIKNLLAEVSDPEIPVLSILDMGIVRRIEETDEGYRVDITPTYSGCPAMKTIEEEVIAHLKSKGYNNISVRTIFDEVWTTDWMSEEGKNKLKEYGIAPPGNTEEGSLFDTATKTVQCPFCNSMKTKLTSHFGSTACKSLHYCDECNQPFEHFKCI
jgi:ring-1,2-phenylacetyl-CoA epoxidase subunit PaaD